jgi:GrpB-like predicted nucleotidyltransferase (UPF0157 family)
VVSAAGKTELCSSKATVIEIVPYDGHWPTQFAAEATRIRNAMGDAAVRIEHVGSTSVPGLAAKPVIDVQVAVASLAQPSDYAAALAQVGYVHVPLGYVDRVHPFFKRPATWPGTHHVHLCVAGSGEERRHLAFRDYLRTHPDVAAQYVELKRNLAAWHDGTTLESLERYSLSKTSFVTAVLALAQATDDPGASLNDG